MSGWTVGCFPPRARTCRPSTVGSSSVTGSSTPSPPHPAPRRCDRAHGGRRRRAPGGEVLAGPGDDASIRITISRGTFMGRGLLPPADGAAATIVIQAWPIPPPPPGHLTDGLHLVASTIRRDPENPLVTLKTTSRVDFVHARL